MDAGIEKECSALGGLFQVIMNDMKASYPTWEDFVTKGTKLQSQLRTTITMTGAFLDAFQKVADMATGTRGATKDIGSALTRMCMRHRSIESKLKLFTTALSESLITPLELKMEEWKKVANQLDKDHAKEYKKARADLKKKSSDTIKLQKKVKKGKDEARGQLDSALQDVNVRYAVLEETEKRAVCRALIEERARYCSFVSMLKPVLDHEINMLGEVTHLQTILEDLISLTAEPSKLPPSSEQVILDLKGSEFNYTYQTPPASPSSTLSRKSSISSNYQAGSVRHVPSLDSICCAVDRLHIQPYSSYSSRSSPSLPLASEEAGWSLSVGSSPSRLGRRGGCGRHGYAVGHGHRPTPSRRVKRREMNTDATNPIGQLASGGIGETENGLSAPPLRAYIQQGERVRAMSTSGKSGSAQKQLTLTLAALNSEAPRSSRDSLHCSSGYSTQTTTPSCSEDTIHSHMVKREPSLYVDYESISLHGDVDSVALHHLSHDGNFDKSSTIPRNSDLGLQFRRFAQSQRPTSTVSLLAEPELTGRSAHQLPANTATIRRKPSSKPAYRRGTISGGVPIPISTPQIPRSVPGAKGSSEDNIFIAPSAGGPGLGYSKLCTSTQSLSALASSSSSSPYYQLIPGQMPIPVPVPTVPPQPVEDGTLKHQQLQINSRSNHLQQQGSLHQGYPQLQTNPPVAHKQQQQHAQPPHQPQFQLQSQQQKQKLFQQQQQQQRAQLQAPAPVGEASALGAAASPQPQAPPPSAESQSGGAGQAGLLSQIRSIKLKRTITDDRSAPLLPPPAPK